MIQFIDAIFHFCQFYGFLIFLFRTKQAFIIEKVFVIRLANVGIQRIPCWYSKDTFSGSVLEALEKD